MTHEGILQGVVGHYEGVPVILSLSALEPHESFRWPYSRHRSQRVHKKLTKRLGPQLYRSISHFSAGSSVEESVSLNVEILKI